MPLQIPGYYYDPDKGKYFKIEKSHTAPSAAAWSSDAVKKRKTEAAVERATQRRKRELRRHVARHGLREDVVLSGLLGREIGVVTGGGSGDAGGGDVAAAGWAEGMVSKGEVPFGSGERGDGRNLPCLWVGGTGGDDGLGVAYTTLDEVSLLGSYIPTDQDGRIRFDPDAPLTSGRRRMRYQEPVRCPQMSSIRYHAPSNKMLLTSREPDHTCGLYLFSPPLSEPGDGRPHWLLGEANFYQRLSVNHRSRSEWVVHSCTPAPPSSDLVCVMATNAGVVRVFSNETMSLVAPPPFSSASSSSRKNKNNNLPVPKEIFDIDFQRGNHNVVFAGGRSPKLWMGDLRTPQGTNQWSSVRHASSIARLRSVNEYQVVVCGLQNSMALYDVRFMAQRPNGAGPLVTFPGHKNEAHVHVGFDACPEVGAVAAAQEDGTVGVFSLASGKRVRCPALAGRGADRGRPVRALMFEEGISRDKTPSLWVGEGLGITKYSFGEADLDHEW